MLKIVTWNCQGAFRKKYLPIAEMAPDLAIIQECEQPGRIPWKQGDPPSAWLWFGDNPAKGLGVFTWTDLAFESLEEYDRSIRYCIPIRVTAPYEFQLVAVWAMDHPIDRYSYSGQIYQALGAYRDFIQAADTIFIGDFNSSRRTTPKSRMGNHPTIILDLNDLWLVSAYHQFFFEKQGKEKRGTYFRGRKPDRPSHIDFAFIPSRWLRRLADVQVGDPQPWLQRSDHCPLIVSIREKEKGQIV